LYPKKKIRYNCIRSSLLHHNDFKESVLDRHDDSDIESDNDSESTTTATSTNSNRGARRKDFDQLGDRRQQQITQKIMETARGLVKSENDVKLALSKIVKDNDEKDIEQLKENVKTVIELKTKAAKVKHIEALLVKNLHKETTAELTNTAPSTLKKRRMAIKRERKPRKKTKIKVKQQVLPDSPRIVFLIVFKYLEIRCIHSRCFSSEIRNTQQTNQPICDFQRLPPSLQGKSAKSF
jgi:hypothetical protein